MVSGGAYVSTRGPLGRWGIHALVKGPEGHTRAGVVHVVVMVDPFGPIGAMKPIRRHDRLLLGLAYFGTDDHIGRMGLHPFDPVPRIAAPVAVLIHLAQQALLDPACPLAGQALFVPQGL